MQSTIGTYTSNRSLGPFGKVKVSKPLARGAAVIGLLQFLLAVAFIVAGVLLHVNDVNKDINSPSDPKYYGLWSVAGPVVVSIFGTATWVIRRKEMIISFTIVNILNIGVCIAQAVFVLPATFWFKDFLTLSNCRDGKLDKHGLEYDPESKDSNKRSCDEMNTIAKMFILLAICCCFSIVVSIAGFINGVLGIRQVKRDKMDQLDGLTSSEFREMEQKTAMWLENNIRFSTGSTIARSEKALSESGFSTAPAATVYRDKSWV